MTQAQLPETDGNDTHIRRQLFKNSGLIVGCRMVTAATALLAIPFITSKLQLDGFGTWELLLAIASLCSMFQTSVNGTLLWQMSQAHGADDYQTIRRMIRIGVVSILFLLAIIGPIIWLVRVPLVLHLHIPDRFISQALWVLPCVVTLTIIMGLNDIMGMAISGCQRSGVVTIIQAGALVVNYTTAIILIRLNFALEGLLIGMVVGAMFSSVCYFRTSSKLCQGISLAPAMPTTAELKLMGRYWSLLMVGAGSAALRDQTDKLVLANFASSLWVGYYGVAARIAFLVIEVARSFYSPLLSAAGSMHAANNWAGVKRLYDNMVVLVGVAAGIVTVVVAGLNDRLMFMWLGYSKPQITEIALILLAGNASAVILTGPGTAICRAIGKVWVETAYVTINLVGNLVLTVILVMAIGPMGTVIASGSTWAVSAIAFTFILPKFVDLPKEANTKARGFVVAVVGCSGITYLLSSLVPRPIHRIDAAIGFFLLGAVSAVLYLATTTVTGLVPMSTVRKILVRIVAFSRK